MRRPTGISLLVVCACTLLHGCGEEPPPFVAPLKPADCLDYGNFLHLSASADLAGTSRRAVGRGQYLYVAAGAAGVHVLDLADPLSPVHLGTVDTPGEALDVAVSDTLLCVADGDDISILSIFDPAAPAEVARLDAAGRAVAVEIRGAYAYVADDFIGLQIIDLSRAPDVRVVGADNTPGSPRDVQIFGQRAFVSDQSLGLRVVDVTFPNTPDTLATLPLSGDIRGIDVGPDGNVVYVAAGARGVHVVDVRDPTRPTLIATVGTRSGARDVLVEGDLLVIADRFRGISLRDRLDPLEIVTNLETPGEAVGVNKWGSYVVTSDSESGVHLVDARAREPVPIRGALSTPGESRSVYLVGNAVYVCDGQAGIQVVDPADPQAPVIATTLAVPGGAERLVVSGSQAYVATTTAGIAIVDATDPFTPQITGSLAFSAKSLATTDSLLLVANQNIGLVVFRIRDAGRPQLVTTVDLFNPFDVVADNSFAFVAWGTSDLEIVTLEDPTQARIVLRVGLPGSALAIARKDDYVLVSTGSFGVQVVDVTAPRSAVHVATLETPGTARDMFVAGDIGYVTDGEAGIHALDLRDPARPALLGTVSLTGSAAGVTADEAWVFAVQSPDGLVITRAQCSN